MPAFFFLSAVFRRPTTPNAWRCLERIEQLPSQRLGEDRDRNLDANARGGANDAVRQRAIGHEPRGPRQWNLELLIQDPDDRDGEQPVIRDLALHPLSLAGAAGNAVV